jgi:hypothetical protein
MSVCVHLGTPLFLQKEVVGFLAASHIRSVYLGSEYDAVQLPDFVQLCFIWILKITKLRSEILEHRTSGNKISFACHNAKPHRITLLHLFTSLKQFF